MNVLNPLVVRLSVMLLQLLQNVNTETDMLIHVVESAYIYVCVCLLINLTQK